MEDAWEAIAILGLFLVVMLVLVIAAQCYYIRHLKNSEGEVGVQGEADVPEEGNYSYDELAEATQGFSSDLIIGHGGFGDVYRGKLKDGTDVAIKRLKQGSGQGQQEYTTELELAQHLNFEHIVAILGYCSRGAERLIVYQFCKNSTLKFHLHGEGRPGLGWVTRRKIALGTAKAIEFLHREDVADKPKIIHRDIKSENILLDEDFLPMLSDFGLACFRDEPYTHITTEVKGTFGYMDPDYATIGRLTEKADVYSFGVVLLEIVSGRKPLDSFSNNAASFKEWAKPLIKEAMRGGDISKLVDNQLGQFDRLRLNEMVDCALLCLSLQPKKRPTMDQVVRVLEGVSSVDEILRSGGNSRSSSDKNPPNLLQTIVGEDKEGSDVSMQQNPSQ